MEIIYIEKTLNTSYFLTLIISLFYKDDNNIINFLEKIPINFEFIYLQDLIKFNILKKIKDKLIIKKKFINEIRNYSIICNFKCNNITDNCKIEDYFNFFFNGIYGSDILRFLNYGNNFNFKDRNYIKFLIKNNCSILDLFNNLEYKSNDIKLNFLPILLIRDNVNYYVDINNEIQFNDIIWKIKFIICYDKDSSIYYSYILIEKKWYIFNPKKLSSLNKVNLKSYKDKIKKNCIFIMYK